jgi:hypothetical protein
MTRWIYTSRVSKQALFEYVTRVTTCSNLLVRFSMIYCISFTIMIIIYVFLLSFQVSSCVRETSWAVSFHILCLYMAVGFFLLDLVMYDLNPFTRILVVCHRRLVSNSTRREKSEIWYVTQFLHNLDSGRKALVPHCVSNMWFGHERKSSVLSSFSRSDNLWKTHRNCYEYLLHEIVYG